MTRLRVYTGPCDVHAYAERARKVGLDVMCEGTEHIYIDAPDSREGPNAALYNAACDAAAAGDHGLSLMLARSSIISTSCQTINRAED